MTLGNEDTTIEVADIVRDTVSHISLDGSGNVTIGNEASVGSLTLGADGITNSDTYAKLETGGGGSSEWEIYDLANAGTIASFNEGGEVQIPTGDLTDGTNVIYDQSASHIPSSRVQTAGLDADTVDGVEADTLRSVKNVAQFTSTNTTLDINQGTWTDIPFDSQLTLDAAYTHDATNTPESITFDTTGTYRVEVSLSYDSNGNTRINPGIKFNINGSRLNTFGLTGYVRGASGHAEGSNTVSRLIDVTAGDTLKVQTITQGAAGTVTMRSQESILHIEQLSESAALSNDANTLDGLDSTAFVKTDGSTNITSTQAISQTEGADYLRFSNTTTGDDWDFEIATDASLNLDVNNTNVLSADAGTNQVTFPQRVTGSSGFDAGSSSVDNVTEVNTTGSGTASFDVYDSANVQDIAQFNEGGLVDIPNGNLRLATGQSIEDGSGTDRLNLASTGTYIYSENGDLRFLAQTGANTEIRADSGSNFVISDEEGGFNAVQYDTDPTAGVLRTPNAGLAVQSNIATGFKDGLNIVHGGTTSRIAKFNASTPATESDILFDNGLIDLSNQAQNLRLATGQSIEDGSGTNRFEILSGYTEINDESGTRRIFLDSGGTAQLRAGQGESIQFYDTYGNFPALEYTTSASAPGTLELTNADLTDGTNVIYDQSAGEIPDSAMGSIANSTLTNSSITVAGNVVSLGGSTTPDASDFSGSVGTAGQYLQTDGTTASWSNITTDVTIEDSGTSVLSTNNINFGTNLTVTDDTDGTVTVDSTSGASTDIDLIDVETVGNLPDGSTLTKPTIAYVNGIDDYVGIFQN